MQRRLLGAFTVMVCANLSASWRKQNHLCNLGISQHDYRIVMLNIKVS